MIFRPTVEARKALYASAKRKGEEIRVQIRNKHSASLKRGKYEKHSIELEEVYPSFSTIALMSDSLSNPIQFQKLNDKYIAAVDKILLDLQKATSS